MPTRHQRASVPVLYTGAWILDRWQLRRELHAGRSGSLWLVRERDTRELAAARIAWAPGQVERAQREGAALSRLAHPGVPRLIDQGPLSGEGGWCVVQEYVVDAAPLGKMMKVTRLAPPRAIGWARQVAAAVAAVHAASVVHGDLHPDNIVVARDEVGRDRLVLVGFGASGVVGEEGAPPPVASPHVVAPERIRGQENAPSVDIYAIGVLIYRMIIDRWPFTGADPAMVLDAHLHRVAPTFAAEAPDLRLPAGLEAIVVRCLEKEPSDRFVDAAALAAELAAVEYTPHRDWVRADGASTPAPVARTEAAPAPAQPGWFVAASLLVVLAFGVWWVWFFA